MCGRQLLAASRRVSSTSKKKASQALSDKQGGFILYRTCILSESARRATIKSSQSGSQAIPSWSQLSPLQRAAFEFSFPKAEVLAEAEKECGLREYYGERVKSQFGAGLPNVDFSNPDVRLAYFTRTRKQLPKAFYFGVKKEWAELDRGKKIEYELRRERNIGDKALFPLIKNKSRKKLAAGKNRSVSASAGGVSASREALVKQ